MITSDSTFREVPIDCPIDSDKVISTGSNQHKQQITFKSNINNAFFFNFNEMQQQENLNFQDIKSLNNKSQKCGFLTKHRSLSTILEEKSFNQNSSSILKENINLKLNDFQLIKALLEDIHVNHIILNEIIRVFKPSSKSGTFQRNIPIRLSSSKTRLLSPDNSIKSPRTSLESSLASKFSPISYRKATSPHKISFNETLVADGFEETKRKLRLVKRLKNNIENIKGGSFNNLSSNIDKNNNNSLFTVSIFTNKKSRGVWNEASEINETWSTNSSENEINTQNLNNYNDEQLFNNDYYDLKLNFSSLNDTNIRPYNIRPVYF